MKIHFISMGGSVMHQLAIALKHKGHTVTGTDDEIFEPAKSNLLKEGLLPEATGWFPDKIHAGLDGVILGMHARADNPELAVAQKLNIPIYSFPEYIYKESLEKTRVVIGGSHGKTTTTAMIMHVLREAGKAFDYLVGARLDGFNQSVRITDAPVIVCEGDEYPASAVERKPKFHFLFPHIAVLTGIAWDHINVFPSLDNYLEQFRVFITKIEKQGHLIYNETDPVLVELINTTRRSDIQYHPYRVPEHNIEKGNTRVLIDGQPASLQVFGIHNLLNIAAAWQVCKQLEVSASAFAAAIASFKGAAKRLERLGGNDHTVVFRDFAHAPSKAVATIDAVKLQFPERRLLAVLELHTYSSLNKAFMKEFNGVMQKADAAVVFFSKHALSIKQLPTLEPRSVQEGFAKEGLMVFDDREQLENWLATQDYENSVLLLMSSGNYDGIDIEKLAARLTRNEA